MNKTFLKSSALLLLTGALSGCTANTSISNASETLMTVGDESYSQGDFFQLLKRASGPALVMQEVQKQVFDAEIGVTDEVKKKAEEQYDEYAESYGEDASEFEEYIKDYGFESKQDYIDEAIIPTVQDDMLFEKYFVDAKEVLEVEYTPVLVEIIETDSETNADLALQAWQDGEETATVAEQYASENAVYTGAEQLILKTDTTIPTEILNAVMDSDTTGIYDTVFTNDTSTDEISYYIVNVINRDYDELVEQLSAALASDSDVHTDCLVYYLTKYNFDVHDQFLFDYWKANNPEYLVSRPDLLEGEDE